MIKYLEKEEDFNTLIENDILLVDFYTEWCGPCKMLGEVLMQIDFVNVLKIDADKFMNLAMKFGIMSVPTLLFFKDGNLVKKEIGFKTLEDIKDIYNNIKEN